jgi:hypothetical protein
MYLRLAFDPLRQAMENAQASMANSTDILPLDVGKKQSKRGIRRGSQADCRT